LRRKVRDRSLVHDAVARRQGSPARCSVVVIPEPQVPVPTSHLRLRSRISIVIVEHNLDLVLALADRVFVLERGAVAHQGPAEPLLSDLALRKKILWL
jgi:ABC-type Na+ transport system ATPase subunit NatA